MKTRYVGLAILAVLEVSEALAQVSTNASLTGKYYFRQVLLITDGTANVTDTHSGAGTLTFDGKGGFTVAGQVLVGTAAAVNLATSSGTYAVNPGGFVTLTNPLKSGATINARLGQSALVGSSTEAGPTVFDLFIAIPAPAQPTSTSTLNGAYWISSLEFPNGGVADIRDANFKLTANGSGSFAENMVTGQAANLNNHLQTQTVGPMTYTVAADGTGTSTFPLGSRSGRDHPANRWSEKRLRFAGRKLLHRWIVGRGFAWARRRRESLRERCDRRELFGSFLCRRHAIRHRAPSPRRSFGGREHNRRRQLRMVPPHASVRRTVRRRATHFLQPHRRRLRRIFINYRPCRRCLDWQHVRHERASMLPIPKATRSILRP